MRDENIRRLAKEAYLNKRIQVNQAIQYIRFDRLGSIEFRVARDSILAAIEK